MHVRSRSHQPASGPPPDRDPGADNNSNIIRFAVLVEIKRPDAELLAKKQYRNGAWLIGKELAAGTARLQADCDRWAKEGSRTDANRDWTESENITTVQPKGILLIGRLAQLEGQTAGEGTTRRESFEPFRRSLWNPEVLTYDELLDRARFLLEQAKPAEPRQTRTSACPLGWAEVADSLLTDPLVNQAKRRMARRIRRTPAQVAG